MISGELPVPSRAASVRMALGAMLARFGGGDVFPLILLVTDRRDVFAELHVLSLASTRETTPVPSERL